VCSQNLFQDEFGVVSGSVFNIESHLVCAVDKSFQHILPLNFRLGSEGRSRHIEVGFHEIVVSNHLCMDMFVETACCQYTNKYNESYPVGEIRLR